MGIYIEGFENFQELTTDAVNFSKLLSLLGPYGIINDLDLVKYSYRFKP